MANAHFVSASAQCSGKNLLVCFKEAGLGSGQTVTIVASAVATATYVCINKGGRRPQAGNKITIVEEISASGQFTADKSGTVRGCLTVPVPSPGTFSCPSGQTLVLQSVMFTEVEVNDMTTGASRSIAGTFTC